MKASGALREAYVRDPHSWALAALAWVAVAATLAARAYLPPGESGLAFLGGLFLYSRSQSSREVVHQGTRARVLAYVRGSPGCTLPQAAKALDLDYTTVEYHLRLLRKHNAVAAHKGPDGALHLYVSGEAPPQSQRDLIVLLANPTARSLAQAIGTQTRTCQELAHVLQLPRSTTWWHLKRFIDLGAVQEVEGEIPKRYAIAQAAKPIVTRAAPQAEQA